MARKENTRTVELQVNAALSELGDNDSRPDVAAYAYSAGGTLLDTRPIDATGTVSLKLPLSADATSVRVLVGPRLPKETGLDEVLRRGAQESHLRVDAKTARAAIAFTILRDDWLCWLRSACSVRGTLLKRITSGGVNLDLPVCHARVEIFEVDPLWIILPKLPIDVLQKIRDVIIDPRRIPLPIPGPGPGPDPAPFAVRSAPVSEHVMDDATASALKAATETTELRFLAQTGSRLQFEQALIRNAVIVRPLLCYFYPRFVTMQKVGETFTDDCGHFRTVFFKGCHNADTPDLYFKAHQRIFGFFELTIYAPTPIACHTWWDYVCGTEVTLHTTSPFAVTCSPCPPVIGPENWVLFTAIGNHSVHGIFGGGAVGATPVNWGLTETGAPWGGILRPRLDFDNSLREALGVMYYEISWRRGTSGDFTPLNAEVYRHYAHMVGSDLVIDPYRLGPNPVVIGTETHQLYEIPPAVPPVGQWTIANAVTDTENGEFNSVLASPGLSFNADGTPAAGTSDQAGLYQIKIELFDAAHNLVDLAASNIHFVVPSTSDLSGTIHTVEASSVAQPGGGTLIVGNALILTLHIDNNHTWAGLGAPTTPAGAADACCGVVPYGPGASVSMPYTAFHPHGFATHAPQIFRSATQILPTIEGGVGSFTITESVSDMMTLARPAECMDKPVCTLAAFGEHLEVYATATDGWGSNLGYNSAANRAFALAPLSEE